MERNLANQRVVEGDKRLGIITSGISFMHAREAAPEASVLKLGLTYPLPIENDRCLCQKRETVRRYRGR